MAKNFGEEVYGGVATFGRIQAIFSAVIGTIIGVIIIIVAIVIISHQSNIKKTMGKASTDSVCVDSTSCTSSGNPPVQQCTTTKSCRNIVEYTVNGKNYRETMNTGNIEYHTGDDMVVYYNANDPANLESALIPIWIPLILIFIGLLVISGGWMWVYITRKSKAAAAIGGAASGIGMISNAIRG
jgi:hypothetical protein